MTLALQERLRCVEVRETVDWRQQLEQVLADYHWRLRLDVCEHEYATFRYVQQRGDSDEAD